MAKLGTCPGLVSIVVPAYNVEKYISDCIDSVLSQNYLSIEVIIVDDGSSDCTLAICNSYKVANENIKVIHKTNGGVSSTRNTGINYASGEFICFVDSDDVLKTDYVQTMLDMMNHGVDVASCSYVKFVDGRSPEFDKSATPIDIVYCDRDEGIDNLLYQKNISSAVWGKMYRYDTIKNCRFNEELSVAEDLDFNLQVLKLAELIAYANNYSGYGYRFNREGSLMNSGFSEKRAKSLDVTKRIYLNAQEENCKINAAANRYFHEAISIMSLLPRTEGGRGFTNKNIDSAQKMIELALSETCRTVLADNKANAKLRLYALLALVSPVLLKIILRIKEIINLSQRRLTNNEN